MQTPDDPKDASTWMEVARRATDVVGEIDFDKVADHDPEELGKLDSAVNKLEVLERGELTDDDTEIPAEAEGDGEHAPSASADGVPDPSTENVPVLEPDGEALEASESPRTERVEPSVTPASDSAEAPDEEPVRVADASDLNKIEIVERLETLGEHRLGRIYVTNSERPWRSLDYVPHRDGLPPFDICIAPDHAPIDGAHGLFISGRGVSACVIAEPVTQHSWRVVKSLPWESLDEMMTIVSHLIERP